MPTTIDLTKIGGLVKVIITNDPLGPNTTVYESPKISVSPLDSGQINVSIGNTDLSLAAVTDISIAGVACTDINDFETQIATVFPDAGSAGGGSATVWRDGSGVPDNSLGNPGDYYLNDVTGDVYLNQSKGYAVVANIKGAAGAPGAAGTNGTNAIYRLKSFVTAYTNATDNDENLFTYNIPANQFTNPGDLIKFTIFGKTTGGGAKNIQFNAGGTLLTAFGVTDVCDFITELFLTKVDGGALFTVKSIGKNVGADYIYNTNTLLALDFTAIIATNLNIVTDPSNSNLQILSYLIDFTAAETP